MFALRAHNNITFLENVLSEMEKVLTAFSIPDKIFSKTDLLMYVLRATLIGPVFILVTVVSKRKHLKYTITSKSVWSYLSPTLYVTNKKFIQI